MNINQCKNCGNDLEKIGNEYICKSCNKKYIKNTYCPKDGSELEKLAACGAVSYWCNKCNELKSRKDVIYRLEEVK